MGMTNWLRRLIGVPTPSRLSDETWQRTLRRAAWTDALDATTRARLRDFTERFLADKVISPAGGLELDDEQRALIAMLCCRPVLHLDYGWLQGWYEVIVYPAAFRRPGRVVRDGESGIVSEQEVHVIGESWRRGPLILSWEDVRASVDAPRPGRDLVVHEIAHKLDGLHDGVDGAPRLNVGEVSGWARDFQIAFDALCADLDAGLEPPIDAYAGTAHAEFFAVCSEYWFTAPEKLRAAYPDVAVRLAAFYGGAAAAPGDAAVS